MIIIIIIIYCCCYEQTTGIYEMVYFICKKFLVQGEKLFVVSELYRVICPCDGMVAVAITDL